VSLNYQRVTEVTLFAFNQATMQIDRTLIKEALQLVTSFYSKKMATDKDIDQFLRNLMTGF
jgi:hypothetical protein